jgi:hypothetical protein
MSNSVLGKILKPAHGPSFEEGRLRPINKTARYLRQGAAGEVGLDPSFDLPGHADSEVAWHLLGRRGHPSSKEGKTPTECLN